MNTIVVKIQTPLVTNEPEPLALIYDKTRKFETFMPIDDALVQAMRGRHKAFFKVQIKNATITIVEEALGQDW